VKEKHWQVFEIKKINLGNQTRKCALQLVLEQKCSGLYAQKVNMFQGHLVKKNFRTIIPNQK